MSDDRYFRPGTFIVAAAAPEHVSVSPRVASLLDKYLTPARIDWRARDGEVACVLADLHRVAGNYEAARTRTPERRERATPSCWLSCAETAERLGVSKNAVLRAARSGRLAGQQRGNNGSWWFHDDDVEAFRRKATD